MSKQLYAEVAGSNWYSHLSLFDGHPGEGRVFVSTTLMQGSGFTKNDITGYMALDMHDEKGGQSFPSVLPGAPRFTPEEWHTMALEVDANGVASLYQDGSLVTRGNLVQYSGRGVGFAHGGPIYGGPSFSEGGYVLVDNFSITCWP